MFRWSHSVPVEEAENWEARLTLAEVAASFLHSPGEPEVSIEAYTEDEAQAEAMVARWGGAITVSGEDDWVALSLEKTRGKTLTIGSRFLVSLDDRPGFIEKLRRQHPDRELLVYPPDVAFGTGDHETTTACLEFLEEVARNWEEGRPHSVLDLGCGTGILGTAAARLGADPVVGLDHDERAVAVARKGWVRNGSPGKDVTWIHADVYEWTPEATCDLVFANIFSEVLIAVMPKIRRAIPDRGIAILSGLRADQTEAVIAAAKEVGFEVTKRVTVGQWSTLRLEPAPA